MRRWRRGLVALAALLLALAVGSGLGWYVLQRHADAALEAAAPASAPALGARALTGLWQPPAAGQADLPVAASAGSPAPPVATASPSDDVMEICGLGRVSRQAAKNWGPLELLRAKAQADALERRKEAAQSKLSARLSVGSDAERVAARLVMRDVEGAAAVAARSADPAAYRLGLMACEGLMENSAAPSCQGLSVQAWARLDPKDAEPWLHLASSAASRRDEAAAAEALDQAMQRRWRSSDRPLLQAVLGARDGGEDAVGLGLAVVDIIGIEAGLPLWSSVFAGRHCRPKAPSDPAQRSRCERYARWQFTHARNLMDARVAVGIAGRVGLPAEQMPYTQDQVERAQRRRAEEDSRAIDASCAGLARFTEYVAQQLADNELHLVSPPSSGR